MLFQFPRYHSDCSRRLSFYQLITSSFICELVVPMQGLVAIVGYVISVVVLYVVRADAAPRLSLHRASHPPVIYDHKFY